MINNKVGYFILVTTDDAARAFTRDLTSDRRNTIDEPDDPNDPEEHWAVIVHGP